MSVEYTVMRCDYPGCAVSVTVFKSTSWRHDFGWGECIYGDCCREHRAQAEADKRLLNRVHDFVASLDVREREKLVAILKVFGEDPGAGTGGIREIGGEMP